MKKTALVCGGGGFIGHHMVSRLKEEGYWVRVADLKRPEHAPSVADEYFIGDLTDQNFCRSVVNQRFDEIYQFAADMGGAGYIFVGNFDADLMYNSSLINLNIARLASQFKIGKLFYSSSACMYPEHNQMDPSNPNCSEDSAYPANPDSEYGWEKLFSERLYLAFSRNHGLPVRIGRFHNIFGPQGTWQGGREKAPAAMCRKISASADGGTIEIWGDGLQTRSFLYIDECIEGVRRMMKSEFMGPVNIGSDEIVTINQLAQMVAKIAGKSIKFKNIPGPEGVRGRNSDNTLIKKKLGWAASAELAKGLRKTYDWINSQVHPQAKPKQFKAKAS